MMVKESAHDWEALLKQWGIYEHLSEQERSQCLSFVEKLHHNKPLTRKNKHISFDQYAQHLWTDIRTQQPTSSSQGLGKKIRRVALWGASVPVLLLVVWQGVQWWFDMQEPIYISEQQVRQYIQEPDTTPTSQDQISSSVGQDSEESQESEESKIQEEIQEERPETVQENSQEQEDVFVGGDQNVDSSSNNTAQRTQIATQAEQDAQMREAYELRRNLEQAEQENQSMQEYANENEHQNASYENYMQERESQQNYINQEQQAQMETRAQEEAEIYETIDNLNVDALIDDITNELMRQEENTINETSSSRNQGISDTSIQPTEQAVNQVPNNTTPPQKLRIDSQTSIQSAEQAYPESYPQEANEVDQIIEAPEDEHTRRVTDTMVSDQAESSESISEAEATVSEDVRGSESSMQTNMRRTETITSMPSLTQEQALGYVLDWYPLLQNQRSLMSEMQWQNIWIASGSVQGWSVLVWWTEEAQTRTTTSLMYQAHCVHVYQRDNTRQVMSLYGENQENPYTIRVDTGASLNRDWLFQYMCQGGNRY